MTGSLPEIQAVLADMVARDVEYDASHLSTVRLIEASALVLHARNVGVNAIVSPRAGLFGVVSRAFDSALSHSDPLLQQMCAQLLANSARRKSTGYTHTSHAHALQHMTPDEARILMTFARRAFAPWSTEIELRYELLRNGLPVRHRETMSEQPLSAAVALARPAMLGAYIANLERLGLLMHGVSTLAVAEDPVHVRARDARGNPPVPVTTQFERWVTGKDVASTGTDGKLVVGRRVPRAVGGIQIIARTVSVSWRGRAFLHAVLSAAMVTRNWPLPQASQ